MNRLRLLKPFIQTRHLSAIGWLLAVAILANGTRPLWMQPPTRDMTPPQVQRAPAIASLHLFGKAPLQTTMLPKCQLPLTLEGTILMPTPTNSIALIRQSNHHTGYYRTGQTLPFGAMLSEVMQDAVIVRVDGQRQIIKLSRKTL